MNIKDSSENPFFVSRRILKVTTNVQSFRGKSKLFGPLELVSCIRQADGRGTSVIIRYLSGEKSSISTKEERSASLDERTCLVDELLISSFLFFFFPKNEFMFRSIKYFLYPGTSGHAPVPSAHTLLT